MAALIKKTLEKRRNRTSSLGESSTSPEAKKQRSDNVSVNEQDETNDTDDEFFAALNMAEGFHKTLLPKAGKARYYSGSCNCGSNIPS